MTWGLKTYLMMFMLLFGALLFSWAIITEGNTVGKFKKPFCLLLGAVMMGAGLYLSY